MTRAIPFELCLNGTLASLQELGNGGLLESLTNGFLRGQWTMIVLILLKIRWMDVEGGSCNSANQEIAIHQISSEDRPGRLEGLSTLTVCSSYS
jgi:hypothetical protein